MNRSQDSVVYCEDDFVMTCDERHGLHTVWKARKVSYDDVNVLQTAQLQQNPVRWYTKVFSVLTNAVAFWCYNLEQYYDLSMIEKKLVLIFSVLII